MKDGGSGSFKKIVPGSFALHSLPVVEFITFTSYPGRGLQAEPGFYGNVGKPM